VHAYKSLKRFTNGEQRMSESKRLERTACLITGGAADIGRATAQKGS
jgi:hypothetical protein